MRSVPTTPPRCGPGNISAEYENSEVQQRGCSALIPWCLQIPASLTPVSLTALSGSPPEGTAKVRMGFLAWLLGCSTRDVAQTRLLAPVPEEPCVRAAHASAKYQGALPSGEHRVNCPANHSVSLISPCRGVLFVFPGLYILYPAFLVIYLRG